jgi:hypothetical protein
MPEKSGVQLIREFFGEGGRPVTLDEMRNLASEDRKDLAEAVAAQRGLHAIQGKDGQTCYVEKNP